MAEQSDIDALRSGEKDLVYADFRDAQLAGEDFSARDLTGAQFDGANLEGANFSDSNIKSATFSRGSLRAANFQNVTGTAVFVSVDLTGARFNGADLRKSHFNKCNFSEVDFRSGNFSHCHMEKDNSFSSAISDETTQFDSTQLARSRISDLVFRFYRWERGSLIRKNDEAVLEMETAAQEIISLKHALRTAQRALQVANAQPPSSPQADMIGHNNPPPDCVLEPTEIADVGHALTIIEAEINSENPEKSIIIRETSILNRSRSQIYRWLALRFDVMADEFSKELGKNLASPSAWTLAWLALTTSLADVVRLVYLIFR